MAVEQPLEREREKNRWNRWKNRWKTFGPARSPPTL
jgi:hypothetical protein